MNIYTKFHFVKFYFFFVLFCFCNNNKWQLGQLTL